MQRRDPRGSQISTVRFRRRALAFILVLILHYVLTWSTLLYMNSRGWERIEHGGVPGIAENAVGAVFLTLSSPITQLFMRLPTSHWFPGLLGHIPFLSNSALWAGAVLWLAGLLSRRRTAA